MTKEKPCAQKTATNANALFFEIKLDATNAATRATRIGVCHPERSDGSAFPANQKEADIFWMRN
jgi:hypothetical protein